jgi:hypothetical protein
MIDDLRDKVAPTPLRIWLIDTGNEITWCDDHDPVGCGQG